MFASTVAIGMILQNPVPSRLVSFSNFDGWETIPNGIQTTVDPKMEWTEVVPSWNLASHTSQPINIEIRLDDGVWYHLGTWNGTTGVGSTSVKGQNTAIAKVDTDTLIHKTAGRVVTIKISGRDNNPDLKFFALCFANRKAAPTSEFETSRGVTILEPPRRAQMAYPGGDGWCSPTATSMVLGYWANELSRKQLDSDVPVVAKSVFDPAWNGTGNWSFNTAFAGSQPGMRAYVARLWNLRQAEEWINAKVPVVCSVSYSLLKGKDKKEPNDGHLVVLVGFTESGDPVFNDPGRNVVRMTYDRQAFERAWVSSGRTCYLIYPKTWTVPENSQGAWSSDHPLTNSKLQ